VPMDGLLLKRFIVATALGRGGLMLFIIFLLFFGRQAVAGMREVKKGIRRYPRGHDKSPPLFWLGSSSWLTFFCSDCTSSKSV
jgi:hypothetical protein